MTEILAPAGSPEAFWAAIEAGADAVYVGMGSFNARQRAKNFTAHDIAVLTDFAHKKGRKVYVAFNTLLKQKELNDAFITLAQAYSCNVDAFIIQDFGVYRMLREAFPEAVLHASTQMAVHNSYGVKQLEKMGFKRAILARELTIGEIGEIKKKTSMELEIFVHGALCFSMSGLCFASSVIGGLSGNRGLCTQPCRRKWNHNNAERYFFSTQDLDASGLFPLIKANNISSLKIEGRMKSPEYVFRTVSYWRSIVDSRDIDGRFSDKYSRDKTCYYMNGMKGQIIDSGNLPAVGTLVGKVYKRQDDFLLLKMDSHLAIGDVLRFCSRNGDESDIVSVREIFKKEKTATEVFPGEICSIKTQRGRVNDLVYISGHTMEELSGAEKKLGKIYSSFRPFGKRKKVQPPVFREIKRTAYGNPRLYIKIDNYDDIALLKTFNFDFLILPFIPGISPEKAAGLAGGIYAKKIIFVPPVFIPEHKVDDVAANVKKFCKFGFNRWIADNISHLRILPPDSEIYLGANMYALNSKAGQQFSFQSIKASISSYEDDFLNMRLCSQYSPLPKIYTLFAYPVLFYSRITSPHFFEQGAIFSSDGFKAACYNHGDYISVVSEKPFSLFQHKKKIRPLGAYGYMLDLSHCPKKIFNTIYDSYLKDLPVEGTFKYNFKRELK